MPFHFAGVRAESARCEEKWAMGSGSAGARALRPGGDLGQQGGWPFGIFARDGLSRDDHHLVRLPTQQWHSSRAGLTLTPMGLKLSEMYHLNPNGFEKVWSDHQIGPVNRS